MSVILDNRERDLMRIFKDDPTYTVKQLDIGDVHIMCPSTDSSTEPKTIVIAERKAVADLEASLTDGRYREQRTRLLATCAEKGAAPLYIIEGPLDRLSIAQKELPRSGNRLGGRKTIEELWTILNRLQMRYRVAVALTDSVDQTADYIRTLAAQVAADPRCFDAATIDTSYSSYVKSSKRATKEDPRNFMTAVLTQCPGVSAAVAETLVEHYKSLPAVLAGTAAEYASLVKPGGRKIGKAVGERLWGLLHQSLEGASSEEVAETTE
jgi:ERCC4-type nuclease